MNMYKCEKCKKEFSFLATIRNTKDNHLQIDTSCCPYCHAIEITELPRQVEPETQVTAIKRIELKDNPEYEKQIVKAKKEGFRIKTIIGNSSVVLVKEA
ncbi:MAG: hypothetical protein ABSB10_09975 [Candidatus Bathyarchaeia archaeon]